MGASGHSIHLPIRAPEGIEASKKRHPDVAMYIGSIDRGLDEKTPIYAPVLAMLVTVFTALAKHLKSFFI